MDDARDRRWVNRATLMKIAMSNWLVKLNPPGPLLRHVKDKVYMEIHAPQTMIVILKHFAGTSTKKMWIRISKDVSSSTPKKQVSTLDGKRPKAISS